jgi:hypothetical protein
VLGFAVISMALFTAAIWIPSNTGIGEFAFFWLFTAGLALGLATIALRHRRSADRSLRVAETIAAVGAYIAVAVGVLVRLLAASNATERAVVWSVLLTIGAGIAAAAAAGIRSPSTVARSQLRPSPRSDRLIGFSGIGAAVAATILAITVTELADGVPILRGPPPGAPLLALALALATLAVPVGVWNLVGISPIRMPLGAIRHTATVTLAVFLALSTYSVAGWAGLFAPHGSGLLLERMIFASAILAGTALLAAGILFKFSGAEAARSARIEVLSWKCPRCSDTAQYALGSGWCRCAGCGLSALVFLRDDRCPDCGYDLAGLPDGPVQCPECGRSRQTPPPSVAPAP